MDINRIITDAEEAISMGQNMTLVTPRPFRNKPAGFPQGELLCEQHKSNVSSYDPKKILSWLKENGLYDGIAI